MSETEPKQLVVLGEDMTQITLTEADRNRALNAAAWIFASEANAENITRKAAKEGA